MERMQAIKALRAFLLVTLFSLPRLGHAQEISYTISAGSPSPISAELRVFPAGLHKPGDEVTFRIRVRNAKSVPATKIYVSAGSIYMPNVELRDVRPQPHGLNWKIAGDTNYNVKWENYTIPANGTTEFVVTYRLDPSFVTASPKDVTAAFASREVGSAHVTDWRNNKFISFPDFILPISSTRGDPRPLNTSVIDNVFYSAFKRFPTASEHSFWTRKFHSYPEWTGPCTGTQSCDRTSFLLKNMRVASNASASAGGLASIRDLNALFRSVYGRTPTVSEWRYWATRLLDKPNRTVLVGAMAYHKAHNIRH
jgi:hypothetical protein